MPPDLAEVRRWLAKAAHDRSAVRKILTPDCEELDIAAFHCQQAIEKMLKAYLTHHAVEFERIHDLGRLLDHCSDIDGAFDQLRDDVEPITLFAVSFRYPGPADPARKDVDHAESVVEKVWDFVTRRLPAETIP